MLVIPEKQKLILKTERYSEIVQAIPHAVAFQHKGAVLTSVDHGVEETLVLRNLGFRAAPAPILSYYGWPGRFTPMSHQKETAAFLTVNRRALVLSAPGTAKTLSSLWAADYLLESGVANRVLIVCPLSTTKTVWGKEITHHLPHREFELLVGDKAKRLEKLGNRNAKLFVVNHDGFKILKDYLDGFDVVIYDEATALKTPGSQRYRMFASWVNQYNPWLWLLTGTPISQSPVDAWTLARLVNSPNVPKSFTTFKDLVMQKVSTFRWIPRDNAIDVCKQVLQPSIRFSLDECTELPQMVLLEHECELTPQQKRSFTEMRERAVLMAHDISAPNMAVVLQKLIQICCGVVYSNDGDSIELGAAGRYDVLAEVLSEIGVRKANEGNSEKCIVFAPLRGVISVLEKMLKQSGYDVIAVHGGITGKARDNIFDAFQNSDRYSVLVAHPAVAAHGLTLTRAKDIVWYAPIYSLEQYEQANARIRRMGTVGKTRVHHLWGTPFERELYRRLWHKQRVLGEFLKLVGGVNE